MKKIILTEEQVKKLVEELPATRAIEYTLNDGRYHMKCQFRFDYGYDGLITYKGGEIDDISDAIGDVSYQIEIDYEPYGIKNIYVTDIKGPESIPVTIRYYPEGFSSEDEGWWEKRKEEKYSIPLNWRKLKVDNDGYGMNYYGLDKTINVDVKPNGKGGLIGDTIEASTKEFKSEEE